MDVPKVGVDAGDVGDVPRLVRRTGEGGSGGGTFGVKTLGGDAVGGLYAGLAALVGPEGSDVSRVSSNLAEVG